MNMSVTYPFKLSLCIPTMNRWSFLKNSIPKYLENPFIDEIVICDETGEDVLLINQAFKSPKLRMFTNDSCLGAYKNKLKVVSLATNQFVCLIDSDNYAPLSYFEAWKSFCKEGPDPFVVYCPCKWTHGMDFSKFQSIDITRDNYKSFFPIGLESFYNDGNYIVAKELYISSKPLADVLDLESTCGPVDVLFHNYNILMNGGHLCIVPFMTYDHVVHNGSYWMNSHKQIDYNKYKALYT